MIHPDAICTCGDRYREHEPNGGACKLNRLGHHIQDRNLDRCNAFVLDEYAIHGPQEDSTIPWSIT